MYSTFIDPNDFDFDERKIVLLSNRTCAVLTEDRAGPRWARPPKDWIKRRGYTLAGDLIFILAHRSSVPAGVFRSYFFVLGVGCSCWGFGAYIVSPLSCRE
jgi:hypothetical protein